METRANYFVIGLFTLVSILAAFAFFLWFSRIEITRQFNYYDVVLDTASGLGRAGDVRFNGILVGRVIDIAFMRDDPGLVRVRIEVDAETPITTDTVARLESQGVTGVSYIGLVGGSTTAAPLEPEAPGQVPVIAAERSSVQALFEDAPDLLAEAIVLLRELRAFASEDNRTRVANILENADQASGGIGAALEDFSRISATVRAATEQIGAVTARLDPIVANMNTVLESADTMLNDVSGAMEAAQSTLTAAQSAFTSTDDLITRRGDGLIDQYEATALSVQETFADVGTRTGTMIAQAGNAIEIATARFAEAEGVVREAETALVRTTAAMASVEVASDNFDALLNTEGAELVAEARTAMTALSRIADEDMPGIVADVREATATVNRVVTTVGDDLTGVTGRLDGLALDTGTLITEATETFRSANATLGAIGPAIETTERALAAAEGAFVGAERVINEDVEGIVTDFRGVATELEAALSQVAADLPALGEDLRATLAAMTRAAVRIETMVDRSAPGVEDFANASLPQWSRLAVEARTLAVSLERLVQRIERDPARFFLGGQAPEYRR
jgi:phospholipid/cholesterol/gamma-HCH transport system substrate-binding protein